MTNYKDTSYLFVRSNRCHLFLFRVRNHPVRIRIPDRYQHDHTLVTVQIEEFLHLLLVLRDRRPVDTTRGEPSRLQGELERHRREARVDVDHVLVAVVEVCALFAGAHRETRDIVLVSGCANRQ